MTSFEELRTTSHELLIELDATTTKMMALVSGDLKAADLAADKSALVDG
jgi:hypothetical protein